MTPQVEQLVREAMELTGADGPSLMDANAPVLAENALTEDEADGFYLVGLIGGKDVGKSALVNALVGRPITPTTSHGPGTETVIAYAHASQELSLRNLLEHEVPGRYRIVVHQVAELRRQVLVDLPDIDSRWAAHLELTRTMLRHMLYPVWVGSIEKYADLQPQQMLAKVAAGNSPGNFIFCLNKADQLSGAAAELAELREDYASRVARTLSLPAPPRVYMISAAQPDRFDLPTLRALLTREKAPQAVRESKERAIQRQDRFLLDWLDRQQLSRRAERLKQLRQDAEETAAARVGVPLLEVVLPRLLDDPGSRMAMTDDILQERVARWPVVNLVHTLLSPAFLLVRSLVARNAAPLLSSDAMVDISIKQSGYSVATLVQTTFAQLRQSQPALAALYERNKLWEDMPAEHAAAELHRSLAATLTRQRTVARERLAGRHGLVAPLFRGLLTIGALLWFPFIQPILEAVLAGGNLAIWRDLTRVAALVVTVLGVNYLLKSATFLILYYAALWLALRWNTQRKVSRLLARWRAADYPDPSLNLVMQTLQWIDGLLAPIREHQERTESLAQRALEIRTSIDRSAAA